ncbi:ETS-PEA3-N domain containing protein [Pyrenophora tritici-repentis]|nr:ETS-PEA3-N domain containing protein [Pyrenophora tritici-repentis]
MKYFTAQLLALASIATALPHPQTGNVVVRAEPGYGSGYGSSAPSYGSGKPDAGSDKPSSGADKPADKPESGDDKPDSGDDKPSSGDDKPDSGYGSGSPSAPSGGAGLPDLGGVTGALPGVGGLIGGGAGGHGGAGLGGIAGGLPAVGGLIGGGAGGHGGAGLVASGPLADSLEVFPVLVASLAEVPTEATTFVLPATHIRCQTNTIVTLNMRFTLLVLATAASLASAQEARIPLGYECNVKSTPCAFGASCYTANLTRTPICGNSQAPCTSDEQCAYNACVQGACSGFKPGASPSPTAETSKFQGALPAPSPTIVAPAGSLPLGAQCNPFVKPDQCKNAQCWASNMMAIATCGGFNAQCTSDDQCNLVTCRNGLCSGGYKPSTSGAANATTATMPPQSGASSLPTVNGTIPTANGTTNGTIPASRSATPTATGAPEFPGAASANYAAGGLLALVAGAVALAL